MHITGALAEIDLDWRKKASSGGGASAQNVPVVFRNSIPSIARRFNVSREQPVMSAFSCVGYGIYVTGCMVWLANHASVFVRFVGFLSVDCSTVVSRIIRFTSRHTCRRCAPQIMSSTVGNIDAVSRLLCVVFVPVREMVRQGLASTNQFRL